MKQKHPEGFWSNQLTDEQVKELTKQLVSKKPKIDFSSVAKITRTDDAILVEYDALRNDCFFRYTCGNCKITDFKLSGGLNYMVFYEFMVELFGEEYVNDFYAYADEYIKNNPAEKWTVRLKNFKTAMPAILDSVQHSNKNEISKSDQNTAEEETIASV